MKREYEEAFVEVDEILKIMPIDLLVKIPTQFRKIISENKATDYAVKIEEPLEDQKLKTETIAILGLMYRDFLASPEERERLQQKDAEELQQVEKEMQEQYDITNVFEQRKAKRLNEQEQTGEYSTDLVEYKEPGFLKKLFNLVKGLFSRK